ncbi:MAG: hypothetical protein K1V76_05715, partial [Candidatus Amulumruptor sp.]
ASVTPAMAEESFAPEAGDFSLELQFNPFSNNFDTFKLERLQGTYMLSDKDGLRFGLGLDVHNNKTIKNEDHDGHVSSKYGDFSINLGYERHFYNYKRVDLYAGAEIIYTHRWAGAKDEIYGADNVWSQTVESINNDGNGHHAGNDFGFNLFTGINFSVYKGLYVGAELGLGLDFENDCWSRTKTTTLNGTDETKGANKNEGFNLAFKANPALRLGWTF